MQSKTNTKRIIVILCAAILASTGCSKKERPVEVLLSLSGKARSIRKATVVVDYSQASARPLLRGGAVSCTSILPGVQGEFSDDGSGRLTVDLSAPAGMSIPTDFAVCRMTPEAPGISGETIGKRLRIRLAQALDTGGKPLEQRALAKATRGAQHGAGASAGGAASPPGAPASPQSPAASTAAGAAQRHAPGASSSGQRGGLLSTPPAASRAGGGEAANGAAGAGKSRTPAGASDRRSLTMSPGAAGSGERASAPSGGESSAEQAQKQQNEAARANANEDTDLDSTANSYEILFGITSSSGPVAALDFQVTFLGDSGGWEGAGGNVNCSPEAASALAAFNDTGRGKLRAGMVWQEGMDTPAAVAACVFKSREVIDASSFRVEVTDASDPDVVAIDPLPVVQVLNVR